MVKPTVISTFAGTGGSSLGYKWAGFKELLAIDFDEHAHECFKANFPEVPAWHRDIRTVTAKEILDYCNIKPGELDIFDGSPPCQGFSTAGKRVVNDERNNLFKDYVRLIEGLMPKVFVMENVTGMIKGKMKGRFIEIMNTLKALDYNVSCKKMNSKYYGVPQSRERLIFIGVRKDLNKLPVYPKASSKLISVKEAFENVKQVGYAPAITNKFIKSIVSRMKPGESASKYHPKGSFFNCSRIHYLRPSQTMTKMVPLGGYIHPLENRQISINECKAICSFPQDWKLGDKYNKAFERLGNAVMPRFMQAIAETIKTEILDKYKNEKVLCE